MLMIPEVFETVAAFRWSITIADTAAEAARFREFQRLSEGVPDRLDVRLDLPNRTVGVILGAHCGPETLMHVVLDLLLPRLLAYDGRLVLHGATVAHAMGAFVLTGPSGQGKSTLSASLHRRGFSLFGDDAALLEHSKHSTRVRAIYPSLRLFPDSLEQVLPSLTEAAPMADYSEKRRVSSSSFASDAEDAPFLAMFRLADPADRICVTRLTAAEACMSIVANSFALDPSDPEEARRRFIMATDIAQHVPVYDLHYPRDYTALPVIHAAILETVGLPACHL